MKTFISAAEFKADGERVIEVYLRDKMTGELFQDDQGQPVKRYIRRSQLSKLMMPLTEHHVTALNGRFVVEV